MSYEFDELEDRLLDILQHEISDIKIIERHAKIVLLSAWFWVIDLLRVPTFIGIMMVVGLILLYAHLMKTVDIGNSNISKARKIINSIGD